MLLHRSGASQRHLSVSTRWLVAILATGALFFAFAASAFGDAADPVIQVTNGSGAVLVPSSTHGKIVSTDANGNFTVEVWGGSWVGDPSGNNPGTSGQVKEIGWQWTTHNSDCNTNRAGVGVAIDWNDPSGNTVVSPFAVGVLAGSAADTLNNADNTIHPTPPLVAMAGFTPLNGTPSAVVLNPTSSQFNDSTDYTQWQGGCGIYGAHSNVALPNNTTKSGSWNTGVWGPFFHTYPASHTDAVSVCPLMYDVHGTNVTTGPKDAGEITAGGANRDKDNSIESNGTTPAGNGCFATTITRITTTASSAPGAQHPAHVGDSISDSATVNGDAPTGSVTFDLYKRAAGDSVPTCDQAHHVAGPDTQQILNTTNANSVSVPSNPVDTTTLGAGTYYWVASYSGDDHNQPANGNCGDNGETTVVAPRAPTVTTTLTHDFIPVGSMGSDSATLNGATSDASGTITYNVYANTTCTGTPAFTSGPISFTGGNVPGSGDIGPFASSGTYQWQAVYSGDDNNAGNKSACGTEAMAVVDLAIEKHADDNFVEVGQQVGFQVTVTGSGPATGVTLNDPLPAGPAGNHLNWSIASGGVTGDVSPSCSITGAVGSQTLHCNAITLGSGTRGQTPQSYSVHVISSTSSSGPGFTIKNDATASATNHADVTDNDTAQGDTNPTAPGKGNTIVVSALAIDKRADANSVQVGNQVGFTIQVTGSGPAKGVTLSDPLPDGPSGNQLNWSIPAGGVTGAVHPSCSITGAIGSQTLNCSAVDLGTGTDFSSPQSYTVHVVSSTSANGPGFTIFNVATASATNHSDVTDDDSAAGDHNNTIVAAALSITKTADASPVDTGNPIGFKVTVTGSGPATGVTLNDPLPAGPSGNTLDWSISGSVTGDVSPSCSITGAVGNETLHCNAVDLGAGTDGSTPQSYTVHVVSATASGGPAFAITNTATASASNHTPVDASASITVGSSTLSINKTADAAAVETGAQVGFKVMVTGSGPARGVTLNDPLPAGPSGNPLDWSVSGAVTGDVSPVCSISGSVGSQTLHCSAIDLGTGSTSQSYTVHVVSSTASNGPAFTMTNIATASATNHPPVDDNATIQVHHPVIAIAKSGPATAQAGDKVAYTLTVTNPGQESFAESTVRVSDPVCNGQPVTLVGKNGDTSGASLDPGDVWTYTCSVQTAVGDTAVHNVASVVGCDVLGKCVDASGSADTALTQPTQIVLPERATPGAAKLLGPTGCVAKAFNARVLGVKIATVVFVLDGKVVKRVNNTKGATTIQLRIDPKKMRIGIHRLVVNITFASGSGTKPKTERLSFQRCAKKLAPPRFTG